MRTGEVSILAKKNRKALIGAIGGAALRFAAAFILARARIFSDFAPFGVAFAGACTPSPAAIVTALGASLGYLSEGVTRSLKYIAAIVLTRAAIRVLGETEIAPRRFFTPLVTLFSMACTGFVYALGGGVTLKNFAVFIAETTLAGGCAYFYAEALSPWEKTPWKSVGGTGRAVSGIILLTTALIGIGSTYLFGIISVGRAAAVLAVMLAAFRGGVGRGCTAGVIAGAAMDLVSGSVPFFSLAYALSAVIAGIFPKNGRLLFSLVFVLADALAVVWMWNVQPFTAALYETFIASVVFLLLPDTVLAKVSAVFPAEVNGYGFLKAREYTRERTERAAKAFRLLYETVRSATGEAEGVDTENIAGVFDRAAEAVCRDCARSHLCWQRDYQDTVDILNNVSPKLTENGGADAADFPPRFSESCINFSRLVAAINAETRVFLCRRQYKRRLSDSRGAAYSRYADISSILKGISDELGGEITVEPAKEKKLIKFLRGLDIEASVAVFRIRGGRVRAEIRSSGLYLLRREKNYLARLSEVLETRLCAVDNGDSPECLVLMEAEPYCAAVGAASHKKRGERISGDKGVFFRTDEGLLYALLSDGMGSGEGAASLSASAAEVLEQFLCAGVKPELALGILGDLMFLRSEENTVSATVDLLCVDLFSGETRIYKYGAAPSYIKRDGVVKRVGGGALPAGFAAIRERGRPYTGAKLTAGAFAVLVSDGVTSVGDDRWLRDMLTDYRGTDAGELARRIIEKAAGLAECEDDMTALVMRFDERK